MSNNAQQQKDIIIYESDDGQLSFNVEIFEDTVWLTQEQMGKLFDKARSTITEHISNIFSEGELYEKVVCRNFRHVTQHGAIRGLERNISVKYYNLDVIISVGYRVKSKRGIQFRQWATNILIPNPIFNWNFMWNIFEDKFLKKSRMYTDIHKVFLYKFRPKRWSIKFQLKMGFGIKQYMLNGYAINETRIRHIESVMNELVSSQKILREDVDRIENLLIKLIEKPIIIHNKINFENKELEEKIVRIIDIIIDDLDKNKKLQTKLAEVKDDISILSQNPKAKNRVIRFFTELGDRNSNIHKTIKGTKIAKNIISDLIQLGNKLKDLL